MDLGIGKLFELIEEYFGKRVSRVILGLVALAVCVYAFDIILERAVWPLSKAISSLDWEILQKNLAEMLLAVGISLVLGLVVYHVATRFLLRKVERAHNESKSLAEEVTSAHNEAKNILNMIEIKRNESLAALDKADKVLEQSKSVLKEAEQKRIEAGEEPTIPPIFDKEDSETQ